MTRLRLDVGYDGTDFSGWAAQPGRRTVAGVLADTLGPIVGGVRNLTVAGRTDAGVHATGQVCHLDIATDRWAALARDTDEEGEDEAPAKPAKAAKATPAKAKADEVEETAEDEDSED